MTALRAWLRRHPRLARLAVRARDLARLGPLRRPPDRAYPVARSYPPSFRVRPVPTPIVEPWPEPPEIERPFATLTEAEPEPIIRYDLALFEQLNAEYASQPVAPAAPRYDQASLAERSRRRIQVVHDHLDLRGKTVLEIGCGAAFEVWSLAHVLGCDAWGIDISPRRSWSLLEGDRVHLVAGDVAEPASLPDATFDRVMSFTVWEHITRPLEAIASLARVLKPGGLAWIRANLYRGPTASHRTRDIHFPFPHLLFSDEVIDEAMRRAGRAPGGSVWVNRLTWEQYETAFVANGLTIRSLAFTRYPLDEAFHRRFEDVLGRYPREDLERGFFQVVLERAPSRGSIRGR